MDERAATLDARWSQLVTAVAEEFFTRRQDPNAVFTHNADARQLRARLTSNDQGGDAFSVTITEDELLTGDLSELARRFVSAYRAASLA